MTFNVQNLFDNIDDPGKDDKAYLPIAAKQTDAHIDACNEIEVESWRNECLELDWSDAALEKKLRVLATSIKQVNGGLGPDIIAFQEVENAAILERLSSEFLEDSAYGPAILIEGQDARGIDVAFLSRLPLLGPASLHPLRLPDYPEREKDTRGVLEAHFELPDGSTLTGFSVHFPAPFHPAEMRADAYQHLAGLRAALPDDHTVFAAGDFNTTSLENQQRAMLERFVRPHWTPVHEAGCAGCQGTYFYAKDSSWSFLDMILFSPGRGVNATWQIRADSVAVANATAAQVSAAGTPERHRSRAGTGVSDHWPLLVRIEMVEKQ
jgi:endonuclease/exonuclease/phosphatase family metal-dependent hydrolase